MAEIGWGGDPAAGFTTPDSEVLALPDIPSTDVPGLNEYLQQLSVQTQLVYNQLVQNISNQTTVINNLRTDLTTLISSSGVRIVHTSVTAADIVAMFNTPIVVVPAVSGSLFIPIALNAVFQKTSPAWTASSNIVVRYTGVSTALLSAAANLNTSVAGRGGAASTSISLSWNTGSSDRVGMGLAISTSLQMTQGTGDITAGKISVAYIEVVT